MRAGVWIITLAAWGVASPTMAQDVPGDSVSSADVQDLMLGVTMNDHGTRTVATFKRLPDGELEAAPDDLRTAGIKPEMGTTDARGWIPLDSLKGVTWRYDEPAQMVFFQAPDSAREPAKINVSNATGPIDFSTVRSNLGFVLNYTLYGTSDYDWGYSGATSSSLNGSFDARLLTHFGTGSTTLLARLNPFENFDMFDRPNGSFTRLDSSWRYTDPENLLVYQLGDAISGSLPWSSSYRFGGFQLKRNFNLRPDLITSPVPNLSGSASVPSTLDLYLNNMKVFSGEVPAGPFDFTGLPFLGGGGDARIVMRDALGREVVTQRQYFFAPNMLSRGIADFSVDAGFVRLGFGDQSFLYDRNVAGSASIRYGLSDWVTLEGHAEATRGLINGGAGVALGLGSYGSLSSSFAGSSYNSQLGGKASAFYQASYKGYSFYIGADRTFGDYSDVGLAIDRSRDNDIPISASAQKVDRIGFSFPLGFDPSSLNLSFSRIR
ncbi:fimbria/pilus outer membrane usher protein [Phyllobacterium sp. 628]|uniref:fimbria/pilus outer membrane usher protein n=1 Tax=Phyllobacterium sp. 628 TaxID=2718938 RepID=UPI001FCED19F|nr:fimbria/pilus outer membrane usher protein [Phyllobacterium sp. 628]